jgi:hypothetical protein
MAHQRATRSRSCSLSGVVESRALGEGDDQRRDISTEPRPQLIFLDVGVLQHVVQQPGDDDRRTLTVGGEQPRHRHGVLDRPARTSQPGCISV